MPLTPEEELELAQLEAEVSQAKPRSIREELVGPEAQAERKRLSEGAVQAMGASFMPGGTANPLSWLARKTGLSSIPDRLMQKAVGLKKYIPGVGDNLMEQGVRGTKSGMTKQVGSKIAQQGAVLDDAIKSIPGTIESAPIASEIAKVGERFTTPGGIVPHSVAAEAEKVALAAKDIAGRGAIAPQEALKLKRIAGEVGYKHGEPLSKLTSQLAQKEGMGYGKALEEAYGKVMPVGSPNTVADANSKLSSLLKARKGLTAPESLANQMIPNALLGGAGYAGGGPEGAAMAIGARYALKSPLVKSYGAHALKGTGSVAVQAPAKAAAASAAKTISQLTPEEEAELQQLERDLASR